MPDTTAVRPILLLEINEVPWRVIDMVKKGASHPNVQAFFSAARTYTTLTRDEGELSPWVTWPSLHRGMPNTEHGVHNLGQDVASFKGVPIWEEYRRLGHSVGVCGSMQSWPPVDPGPGGFYVPDTFAHDERCIPDYLEPLQRFNLSLVRKNGLVARDSGILSKEFLELIPSLGRARIRPRTLARIAAQLAAERRDPTKRARRAIFQSLLFWDVFQGLYDPRSPPAFATFFTNHVAGVMHRYWDQVFPEDFGGPKGPRPHADTMRFALDVTDEILSDAMEMTRRCPDLVLVFVTSMGQAAVHRQHEGYSAQVTDLGRLLATFGVRGEEHRPLLAMVPQVAAEIDDPALRARARAAMERAVTASGQQLLLVDEVGKSLSITVATPSKADISRGGFQREAGAGAPGASGASIPWGDAGITMNQVDPGTAYHIPEGVMAVYGRGIEASDARTPIAATDVKRLLMGLGGLSRGGDEAPRSAAMAGTRAAPVERARSAGDAG
jgi:hypothetical protein